MSRPGTRLRSLAQRFCDPSTLARLIDPVIADLQHEHADALSHGRVWHARRVRVAGSFAFWKVAAVGISQASAHALSMPHDGAVGRTIRFSGLATTVLTLVFMSPPVWNSVSHPGHRAAVFLALVPQAMSVALPMGVVFGVLCGLRGRVATPRVRHAIVGLTIISSLAMIGIVGWVLPASNQAFREVTAGRPVAKGMNELTLVELRQLARNRFVNPLIANRRAFEFHFRLALAFAPLCLGLFSLSVSAVRRRTSGFLVIGAIALASCLAYYSLMYFARAVMYFAPFDVSEHLPAIVAAWAPDVVFLVCGLLLWKTQRREPSAAAPGRPEGAPLAGSEATHQPGR